jgi:hypothetical protein
VGFEADDLAVVQIHIHATTIEVNYNYTITYKQAGILSPLHHFDPFHIYSIQYLLRK